MGDTNRALAIAIARLTETEDRLLDARAVVAGRLAKVALDDAARDLRAVITHLQHAQHPEPTKAREVTR